MRISDWSSDVCSSDLRRLRGLRRQERRRHHARGADADHRRGRVEGAEPAADQLPAPAHLLLRRFHAVDGAELPGAHDGGLLPEPGPHRSEEHTPELQSLMRISYAVFCLKKTKTKTTIRSTT